MKRTPLLSAALLAGLALPAFGLFAAPAEAAVTVVVPRPTIVINAGGQPAPEPRPEPRYEPRYEPAPEVRQAPVVVREVERVRYVPVVYRRPVERVRYVEVPVARGPYVEASDRRGHGRGHRHH